jgi:hypothetical protein
VAGTSVTFSLASPSLTDCEATSDAAASVPVSSSDSLLLSSDFRVAPFGPLFDGKTVSPVTGRGGCPESLWTTMIVHRVRNSEWEG